MNGTTQDFPLSPYIDPADPQASTAARAGAKGVKPGSETDWFSVTFDQVKVAPVTVKLTTVNDVNVIDQTGKNTIIVAMVANKLHFRIFDAVDSRSNVERDTSAILKARLMWSEIGS